MSEPNDALKAVEALCDILEEIVMTPGLGNPQLHMFAYKIKRLRDGCAALRGGYRTGVAGEILKRNKQ